MLSSIGPRILYENLSAEDVENFPNFSKKKKRKRNEEEGKAHYDGGIDSWCVRWVAAVFNAALNAIVNLRNVCI